MHHTEQEQQGKAQVEDTADKGQTYSAPSPHMKLVVRLIQPLAGGGIHGSLLANVWSDFDALDRQTLFDDHQFKMINTKIDHFPSRSLIH